MFHDIKQNSDEWYQLRAGKITSSKLGCIMANYGKCFGEPAKKYAVNIAIEKITGMPLSSDYTNEHMQRGTEQEPLAREEYCDAYFCDVTNGGFFENGDVGCSPDGMVDSGGVIEIKSVIGSVHYANIKRGSYDPAYKWQCIGNLKFTGRDWLDFVSYCSDFPAGKNIYTYRIYKDAVLSEFDMIDLRINEFRELINISVDCINNSNYLNV